MVAVVYKRLAVAAVFNALDPAEKLYAHHISRAAWYGARITFRQVSPEANSIFDLLIELHKSCNGDWFALLGDGGHTDEAKHELHQFMEYAALFLSNMGNYYGQGDQKFTPEVSRKFVESLTSKSLRAKRIANDCLDSMLSSRPGILGYPSSAAQSTYYPNPITAHEVQMVSDMMVQNYIGVENTRIVKNLEADHKMKHVFDILQASVERDNEPRVIGRLKSVNDEHVRLVRGDHSQDLKRVNEALSEAAKYCANETQRQMLEKLQDTFRSGDLEAYREAQRTWVKDRCPKVEVLFGFIEAYRDPYGTRAEFEGVVSITDPEGSKALNALVERSQTFIAELPWVKNTDVDGLNGPFESDLFEPPEYTSVHALTYSSSMVYLGINLPNFEDIRQTVGFKNVFIANRDQPLADEELVSEINAPFVYEIERKRFLLHLQKSENQKIAIHELLGHGSGKLLTSASPAGVANFDVGNPPVSPLTMQPIQTWYKKGETYNGVFGDLATSMEECRAECVGAYLMFESELLAIFGYTEMSEVKPADLIYNLYLHIGVMGLNALLSYNAEISKWGQAHDRGHFAMFQVLLAADGFMSLEVNKELMQLRVRIDESKIESCGRKAIGELLLHIHIYRCTADVEAARKYYGELTAINDEWLSIREIVASHKPKREIFVQSNTILEGQRVGLREYAQDAGGVLQSWADRSTMLSL